MRQRFGALLCLLLGAVLIGTGLSQGSDAAAGSTVPGNCSPDSAVQVGSVNPGTCPTGTIQVTESTDTSANPSAASVAKWQLTVSSVGTNVCNLPSGSTTQTVSDGKTVDFDGLYVFQSADSSNTNVCQYEITETPVAGFTTSYDPTAPYSFKPVQERAKPAAFSGQSPIAVTVTNTAVAVITTTAPSSTQPSSTAPISGTASTSAPVSSSATSGGADGASAGSSGEPASASAAPILATTGPARPIRASLVLGIALCLLGFVLLFAGRRPRLARFARHSR